MASPFLISLCFAVLAVLSLRDAPLHADAACSADMMKLLYSVACSKNKGANLKLRTIGEPIFAMLTVEVPEEGGTKELPLLWAVNTRNQNLWKHAERLLHRRFLRMLSDSDEVIPASIAQKARIYTSLQPCRECALELLDSTIQYTDICFDQWDPSTNAAIDTIYFDGTNSVQANKKVKNTGKTLAKGDRFKLAASFKEIKANLVAKHVSKSGKEMGPQVDWDSKWNAFALDKLPTPKSEDELRAFDVEFVNIADVDWTTFKGDFRSKLAQATQSVCTKLNLAVDDKGPYSAFLKGWEKMGKKKRHVGAELIVITSTHLELQNLANEEKTPLSEETNPERVEVSTEGTTPQNTKVVQKVIQKGKTNQGQTSINPTKTE